jgi:predicted enzyme related to lactoylglutathione lyase
MVKNPPPIDAKVRIGHAHLKVADLERAIGFYRDVLGFELTQRFGSQAAFLSAGGYHHHIGLNTWESAGGSPVCITWRFCIQPARCWLMRCVVCGRRELNWTARRITA